jgi:Tfp pilus assembly protein PilO
MAGFVSDFARRPLGVKIATFAAIGAALGLLYWQLVYKPIEDDITRARAAVVTEIKDQKDLRKQKTEFDDLVVRKKGLATKIEQNQKALPTEAEMPAFFDMLSRKISEAGVEAVKRDLKKEITLDPNAGIAQPKPANAAQAKAQAAAAALAAQAAGPKTVFLKVPVEIEISGNFYQLKRFFASLRPRVTDRSGSDDGEAKDRLVTIENLSLGDPRVKNSEIVLTARFTASTFRAVTEQPAVKPGTPGAGAGSGSGAGTGSGSAAPGATANPGGAPRSHDEIGPANTPARAKAQAEAAARAAGARNLDPDDMGGP